MPVISTNTAANTALRYLNNNASEQSSSIAKLSSGSRINKASDDAAGLAIGTRIDSDVTTLNQAATNAAQGSAILQTADGGLARIGDILERMKALATSSNSGALTDSERALNQSEFAQLADEVTDITTSTRYNGESLLTGDVTDGNTWSTGVNFQVGTDVTDTISVQIGSMSTLATDVNAVSVGTQAGASAAITTLDTAIDDVTAARASVGAIMSRMDYRSEVIATSVENLSASESVIMDTDVAAEQTKLSSAEVKTQAAIAALSSANSMPQNLLKLLS